MSAGAIRAGKAFVEVGADTNPLTKGLKYASRRLKTWSGNVAAIGAQMIGAGAALLTPIYMAISAGSDLEETMNKFNVVFDKNAAAVKAWGDEYGAQVGRSKRQIADFLASNQDLLVPMGFEQGAATQMSKDITQLSVDLASFNNKADGDVLRDLQAALTGSGEVMKKYGVIVSQAAVNQELLNMKMNPKTATEAEKAQARWNIIIRGTTAAQGDALRSSNSWANQKKALAATIENVSGAIGSKLLPVVTPLLSQFRAGVEIIGNLIAKNAGLVFAVTALGAGLVTLGGLALGLALALKVAAIGAGALATVVGLIVSPLGLITAGLAAIVYYSGAGSAALAWLAENFGHLGEFAGESFKVIKKALDAGQYGLAAKTLWAAIKVAWYEGTQGISASLTEWKEFFSDIWEKAIDTAARYFIDAWANLKSVWTNVTSFFADAWTLALAAAKNAWIDFSALVLKKQIEIEFGNPAEGTAKALAKTAALGAVDFAAKTEKAANTAARDTAIQERAKTSAAELANIAANREGAGAVLDEEAKKRDAARQARIKAARAEADEAVKEARAELKALTAEVNALPDAEKTGLVKNAKQNAGFANSPTAQKALGAGGGDLRTAAGLEGLVKLINQSGRDQSLEELKAQSGLLNQVVALLDVKPKTLKTDHA